MSKTVECRSYFRIHKINILLLIFVVCALFSVYRSSELWKASKVDVFLQHAEIVNRFYGVRKDWNLSRLGEVMYKNKQYSVTEERSNKTFVVYKANHKGHGKISGCSVTNCIFTGKEDYLQSADAVIVRIQLGTIPKLKNRNAEQIWMFLNDEAPWHAFSLAPKRPKLSELHNVFNWSLTYRSDADVPVPYGRTVALKAPKLPVSHPPIASIVPNWARKRRDVPVAILISNCGVSYRMSVIDSLKKYLPVDVYGKCGLEFKNSCPGHFRVDCNPISEYLFYLALENSKCKEYMTEKIFYNAYSKGAIPIIQGPTLQECETFLPPNSFLHLDNYKNYKDLAKHIKRISQNREELLSYHAWRNNFEIVNEHGYFGMKSSRLCRVCEALNLYDGTKSVYSEDRLKQFLDPKLLCRK